MATGSSRQRQSTYHSPLRARQAAETRQTVLGAATRLFTERGWAGTTLAAVAAEAGTAVETVYSAFGSKSGLLIAAIDVAIVGDDDEEPLVEQPGVRLAGRGRTLSSIGVAARIITRALVGAVPLMGALQEASASDEAAKDALGHLRDRTTCRDRCRPRAHPGEQTPETLVDSMWALASPEVFTKLTKERGWPVEHYEQWLVETASPSRELESVEDARTSAESIHDR